MNEENKDTVSDSAEQASDVQPVPDEESINGKCKKSGFLEKIKEQRKKKSSDRQSMMLDIIVLVIVFVFAAWFSPKKYVGQHTSLMYYYEDATVIDCKEVIQAKTGDHCWRVSIQYDLGSGSKTKNLYYTKNPKLSEGDIIHLKIQTVNPDHVEIKGVDRK